MKNIIKTIDNMEKRIAEMEKSFEEDVQKAVDNLDALVIQWDMEEMLEEANLRGMHNEY